MRPGRHTLRALAAMAVLAGLARAAAGPARTVEHRRRVCVLVFRSRDCQGCKPIERGSIDRLARTLGCDIQARYLSVDEVEHYGTLVRLEQQFGDEGNTIPVVFLGGHVLGGVKEIEASFAALVERYASQGGAEAFPSVPPPAKPDTAQGPDPAGRPIYVAYFDSPGCRECRRVEHMLRSLCHDLPAIRLRTFVTADRESQLIQEAISHRAGVPAERCLLTPTVVIGPRPFIQGEITDRDLRAALGAAADGTVCPWAEPLDLAVAEQRLFGRLRSVGLGAVIVGGLIDGVNPCAFATLILFISFMHSAGRDRGRLLAIGLSFVAAVFATYLAIGLGLAEVMLLVQRVPCLDAVVTWGIVALCAALAALSIRDALLARRGNPQAMALQLPKGIKERIRLVLIRFGRTRYLVLGGLLIGGLISMLELVCTGQIYFPLIRFMVASGGARARAIGLLIAYNVCFVVPLILILLAACLGATSERLTIVLRRHLAATKVAIALVFAALAALLVVHRLVA